MSVTVAVEFSCPVCSAKLMLALPLELGRLYDRSRALVVRPGAATRLLEDANWRLFCDAPICGTCYEERRRDA